MANRYYDGQDMAKRYMKYRIQYPKVIYKFIVDYYDAGRGANCNFELAVDVGCGSGQVTLPLAEYFNHVIGCDVSEDQVKLAPRGNDKVEFKVSPAEQLGFLEDNSVDLLTAGAAFHYFDQEAFYKEAKRVLKPGGVLAIFAYGHQILDNRDGQKVLTQHFDLIEPYQQQAKNLDNIYNDRTLPFPEWKGVFDNDLFSVQDSWTIPDFIGSLSISHACEALVAENPQSDYLGKLQQRLAAAYKCEDFSQEVVQFTQKASLLIGRKPIDL